jgi:hypothetical protein
MAEDDNAAAKHARYYERSQVLLQGTILRSVPIYEETVESTLEAPSVRREDLDVIVLTQSCDILNKASQPRLLVAEVQTYSAMVADRAGTESATTGYRKHLVRGTAVSDLLLPPCALLGVDDYLIVNFRELHSIFKSRVASPADGFVCLASPFREQLSQEYARFHMRVGVPTPPLHEFEKHQPKPVE